MAKEEAMTLSDEAVERAAQAWNKWWNSVSTGANDKHMQTAFEAGFSDALEASGLVDQAARADLSRIFYARALESLRGAVGIVVDGLDDEGDRVYLGSTNHADTIRDAWQEMDALAWDEIMEDTQPKTELAAVNLELQERISDQSERIKALEAKLATAREALTLAANRMDRTVLEYEPNSTGWFEMKEWAQQARSALDAIEEKSGE